MLIVAFSTDTELLCNFMKFGLVLFKKSRSQSLTASVTNKPTNEQTGLRDGQAGELFASRIWAEFFWTNMKIQAFC